MSSRELMETRLDVVLSGRKAYAWAEQVGLSSGTMNRLKKGQFPDPEKLVPACRIENLSLSWLIDGMGSPYLVHAHADDRSAARTLLDHLQDEPGWHVFVLRSNLGWAPVLHQPVEATTADGTVYRYRAVEVIAGPCGQETAQVIVAPPTDAAPGLDRGDIGAAARVTYATVDDTTYASVVEGRVGTHALFGIGENISGIAARAQHALTDGYPNAWRTFSLGWPSAEDGEAVTRLTPQQRELLKHYAKLGESDRDAVLRMVRGLTQY